MPDNQPLPAPCPPALDRLAALLGPRGLLTDPADLEPHLADWRALYRGRTPCVVRPGSVAELAEAVRLCAAAGAPLVPQGGNTSMVGGATPDEGGRQVVVSLARLNRVRDIDPLDMTMTAEAGVSEGGAGCRRRRRAASSRSRSAPRGRRRSAACCRPMPAATPRCATAMPAT